MQWSNTLPVLSKIANQHKLNNSNMKKPLTQVKLLNHFPELTIHASSNGLAHNAWKNGEFTCSEVEP